MDVLELHELARDVAPAEDLRSSHRGRRIARRAVLAGVGLGIIIATFAYLVPSIASYGDAWALVRELSWPWVVALAAATVLNIATFAPPWQVALPGLRFIRALELTQASTALSLVAPAGAAVGAAGAYGMSRRWGFARDEVARAVTVTSLWNQLLNLSFPVVALFLLSITGDQTPALATAAFIGVAALGIIVAGLVLVLVSNRLAHDLGDVAARLANWARRKVHRGPVTWAGRSFERFRDDVGDFLERRWPTLTLTSLAGSLTVFGVLLVSLRAVQVSSAEVSAAEAFGAWALVRILASVPLTPGGAGIVEAGLTGTLVGFGGNNAGVVAAVLLYRFLTIVPTLVLGAVAAALSRRRG
jgi:putative heme transporter